MQAVRRLSSLATVFRNRQLPMSTVRNVQFVPTRNMGGGARIYRASAENTGKEMKIANVLMFLMWFTIFYNTFNHFDHLVGHNPYPDPSKWTDEELGIPPDDEDV